MTVALKDEQFIFKEPALLYVNGNEIRFGNKRYVLKWGQMETIRRSRLPSLRSNQTHLEGCALAILRIVIPRQTGGLVSEANISECFTFKVQEKRGLLRKKGQKTNRRKGIDDERYKDRYEWLL